MRPAMILTAACLAAASALGCGAPTVEVPPGNDKITSDKPADTADLAAPEITSAPSRYPYAKLALRGKAVNGVRVIVEGAGNPIAGQVEPIDGTFCVDVELATPAHYTLSIKSQAGDKLSKATTVQVERANDAPAPTDEQLCDGSPAS